MQQNPVKMRMYDGDTLKWESDGKLYGLHVYQDDGYGDSPRDWDNVDIMACWHRRYDLGDKVKDATPEQFWQRLVRENVSDEDIFKAALAGELDGIRLARNEDDPECYDIYETCYLAGFQTKDEAKEYLEYSEIGRRAVADYILDDLTIGLCQKLMEPHAEWLDLWLYDHSGITMSCSRGGNPFYCPWDSGQVGWIITLKEQYMKECCVAEDEWRERAVEMMKADVNVYDQFLTGDVYGYKLYEAEIPDGDDDPEWTEIDSCWGFYGSDIYESGMADYLPDGLEEGVMNDGTVA